LEVTLARNGQFRVKLKLSPSTDTINKKCKKKQILDRKALYLAKNDRKKTNNQPNNYM